MAKWWARPDVRVVIAAAVVLVWRLAAALSPYRDGRLGSMSSTSTDRLLLGGMGVVFVMCALWAHGRRRDRAGRYFVLFALASGLHWGGPIELGSEWLEGGLVLAYLVVSDLLAAAWRVELGRHVTSAVAARRGAWWPLYIPACIAAPAGLGLVTLPADSDLASVSRAVLGGALATSTLLGLLFAGLLVARSLRPRSQGAPRRRVLAMLAAFLLASLTYLLGAADIYNLSFLLEAGVYSYVVVAGANGAEARNLDGLRR